MCQIGVQVIDESSIVPGLERETEGSRLRPSECLPILCTPVWMVQHTECETLLVAKS